MIKKKITDFIYKLVIKSGRNVTQKRKNIYILYLNFVLNFKVTIALNFKAIVTFKFNYIIRIIDVHVFAGVGHFIVPYNLVFICYIEY